MADTGDLRTAKGPSSQRADGMERRTAAPSAGRDAPSILDAATVCPFATSPIVGSSTGRSPTDVRSPTDARSPTVHFDVLFHSPTVHSDVRFLHSSTECHSDVLLIHSPPECPDAVKAVRTVFAERQAALPRDDGPGQAVHADGGDAAKGSGADGRRAPVA